VRAPTDRADGGAYTLGMNEIDHRSGLCASCVHARPVTSGRGSTFVLCGRSQSDANYPKYPRLPVTRCAGFEGREGTAASADGEGS
jgi:hypothetical protein